MNSVDTPTTDINIIECMTNTLPTTKELQFASTKQQNTYINILEDIFNYMAYEKEYSEVSYENIRELCQQSMSYINFPYEGETLLTWYMKTDDKCDNSESWINILRFYGALTTEEVIQKTMIPNIDIIKYMCKLNNMSDLQIIVATKLVNLQNDQNNEYDDMNEMYNFYFFQFPNYSILSMTK